MNAYRGKHVSSAPRRAPSLRRGRHQVRHRHRRRWLIFILLLILVFLSYPLLEARFLLQTEKTSLKCEDLPAEANNLRIVFLSDIHYGFWFGDGDLSRLVSRINNLRPDLILFGGDYATDNATAGSTA